MLLTYNCLAFFDGLLVLKLNSVKVILRSLSRDVSVAEDAKHYCSADIFLNSLETPGLIDVRGAQNCAV